jgi:hypothetical protein
LFSDLTTFILLELPLSSTTESAFLFMLKVWCEVQASWTSTKSQHCHKNRIGGISGLSIEKFPFTTASGITNHAKDTQDCTMVLLSRTWRCLQHVVFRWTWSRISARSWSAKGQLKFLEFFFWYAYSFPTYPYCLGQSMEE